MWQKACWSLAVPMVLCWFPRDSAGNDYDPPPYVDTPQYQPDPGDGCYVTKTFGELVWGEGPVACGNNCARAWAIVCTDIPGYDAAGGAPGKCKTITGWALQNCNAYGIRKKPIPGSDPCQEMCYVDKSIGTPDNPVYTNLKVYYRTRDDDSGGCNEQ